MTLPDLALAILGAAVVLLALLLVKGLAMELADARRGERPAEPWAP